ncbi:MAG: hypothetical protein JWP91_4614 [Fibrobacteres bacterium]|nr:hypothetical protein [Fibrobacterota bacterium]
MGGVGGLGLGRGGLVDGAVLRWRLRPRRRMGPVEVESAVDGGTAGYPKGAEERGAGI